MLHVRLANELEKIKPVREKPVKKATTGYTVYISENFNSQKKPGMDSKAVRDHMTPHCL